MTSTSLKPSPCRYEAVNSPRTPIDGPWSRTAVTKRRIAGSIRTSRSVLKLALDCAPTPRITTGIRSRSMSWLNRMRFAS